MRGRRYRIIAQLTATFTGLANPLKDSGVNIETLIESKRLGNPPIFHEVGAAREYTPLEENFHERIAVAAVS